MQNGANVAFKLKAEKREGKRSRGDVGQCSETLHSHSAHLKTANKFQNNVPNYQYPMVEIAQDNVLFSKKSKPPTGESRQPTGRQ